MLCQEFRKPGGGKGRPARHMKCILCNATWEDHGSAIRTNTTKIKKRKIKATESEPEFIEIPIEMPVEVNIPVEIKSIKIDFPSNPVLDTPYFEKEVPPNFIDFKFGSKIDPLFNIANDIFR